MRVCFVCNELPPRPHGGIGTFVDALAPAIARAGHEVTIVQFAPSAGVEHRGPVRVISLPANKPRRGSWLLDRIHLARALNHSALGPFDIVETPDFEGWLPFGVRAPRLVTRLHMSSTRLNQLAGVRPRRGVVWRESRTLRKSDAWIAVSGHALDLTRETFPTIRPPQVRTIFCPVVLRPPAPDATDPEPRYVLFAGHVTRAKGADMLADVARPVLERHPDLKLVYAGAIPSPAHGERPLTDDILARLGPVASRCIFLGFVPRERLGALMQRATCLALTSRLETFGLVAAEAMLLGCPVVTHRVPPFTEYLEHDRTALLCANADEWTRALDALAGSPELRSRLAQHAERVARERFSIEQCVRETLAFYDEILTG